MIPRRYGPLRSELKTLWELENHPQFKDCAELITVCRLLKRRGHRCRVQWVAVRETVLGAWISGLW